MHPEESGLPKTIDGHSDVHATIQHLLGIEYKKNTFPYEGRDESLVGVNQARVINEILA